MRHDSLVSVAALCLCASASQAQQTIEYRWVERHGQTAIGPGAQVAPDGPTVVGHTDSDLTILLTLEARVVGQGPALGISTFIGNVVTNDPFGTHGAFMGQSATTPNVAPGLVVNSARATAAYAPSYQGYVDEDDNPLPAGRGIFNPFRQIANLGDISNGALNDNSGSMAGLQAPAFNGVYELFGNLAQADYTNNLNTGAEFGLGVFVPLFAVRYDVNTIDLSQLTFTFTGYITSFSGFASGQPVEAQTIDASTTYTVSIIPAPGAAAVLALAGVAAVRRRRV